MQESNTFLPERTRLANFQADVLLRSEALHAQFADAPHEIGGFFAGLSRAGIQAVPIFAARAMPYGAIEGRAFSQLTSMMLDELKKAGQLDGLLVAPHGATVCDEIADADGHWLKAVREQVGPDVPMIATIDPHANLSQQMVTACGAIIAYRTNPHVDQRDCGEEAAELMARVLRREVRPTMAAEFPPMAISIECQATSDPPCEPLYRMANEVRRHNDVLSTSIVLGFPYADVPEMGSTAIVVTDGNEKLARQYAQSLASAMWRRRREFVGSRISVDEAIRQALNAEPPVCLLDMGDNVGGGAPGDGTWIANALLAEGIGCSLVVLCDQEAVLRAASAGVGSRLLLNIGARSGELSGTPLVGEFTVKGLFNGRFQESRAVHGGFTKFDQGLSAVLTTEKGMTVLATSRRMAPFSLGQLTSCGLDPKAFRIVVTKGVNAPLAAYKEVCRTFIRVDTPGFTAADMTSLTYHRRRRPMFPFEPDCIWDAPVLVAEARRS